MPVACPACGTENADAAKFCSECGTSLAATTTGSKKEDSSGKDAASTSHVA